MVRVQDDENVLIIGAPPINVNSRHRLTSQIPGATVVENVELTDLVSFSINVDHGAADTIELLVRFAVSLMTGIDPAALLPRVQSIQNGRNRAPPSPLEHVMDTYSETPSLASAAELLEQHSRLQRPTCMESSVSLIETGLADANR